MYIERKNEARSYNYCYSGKALSITYCECVFVALGIQHALRMRHIVICGLPGFTKLLHIISKTARFKRKVTEHKMSVLIFSTTFVWKGRTDRHDEVTSRLLQFFKHA